MNGPKPRGYWTSGPREPGETLLEVGRRYVVATAFTDFDGDQHPEGENWTFLAQYFLPYDDGLSLFVSFDEVSEWHIRLQWRPDTQGEIINHLNDHVKPV